MSKNVVITGVARTPMGGLLGSLSSLRSIDLGAVSAKASIERSKIPVEEIDQIIMGCVLPAGLGQAPARQVALGAGMPLSVQATTVNKMCGSGMQAVILGHDMIVSGRANVVMSGGMESMSQAPYMSMKHRSGNKFGHAELIDHMLKDGLEDAYEVGTLMGVYADRSADKYEISRNELDQFAVSSLERAKQSNTSGLIADEITSVTVTSRKGDIVVDRDEQPFQADVSKIPLLKPAFSKNGRTTPANASSISDGASTMLLMSEESALAKGIDNYAVIRGIQGFASEPGDFCSAPTFAMQNLLERLDWSVQEIDLFEINEAFAVVPLISAKIMDIPLEKINVRGGACALGHPIGASGARIITTLISALRSQGGSKGVASICLGGGEGLAVAVEVK